MTESVKTLGKFDVLTNFPTESILPPCQSRMAFSLAQFFAQKMNLPCAHTFCGSYAATLNAHLCVPLFRANPYHAELEKIWFLTTGRQVVMEKAFTRVSFVSVQVHPIS